MINLNRISRVALCALPLGILAAPSCTPLPVGETMIVLQTDLSLPKDVDRVTIQALVRGDQRHFSTFDRLGESGQLQIPASIGLTLGPDTEVTTPVTFRVTAFQGTKARVLREVVTTIPENRLVALKLPIQWLCWDPGLELDQDDHAISNCPENQTCIAGTCADSTVDPSTLDDYSADAVFGGGTGKNNDGTCFDTTACFATGADIAVQDTGTECLIKPTGEVNVAIRADTAGICGAAGCFVPIDAKSDLGWQPGSDGTLKLPYAVCERIKNHQASGVSIATASDTCPLKTDGIPACGPWSSAGAAPPNPADEGPVVLAANQVRPLSIAVIDKSVFWTLPGDSETPTGAIKKMPIDGGPASLVVGKLNYARDLAAAQNDKGQLTQLVWTSAGVTPAGMSKTVNPSVNQRDFTTSAVGVDVPLKLDLALGTPEGIAVGSLGVFFTDIAAGSVYRVDTNATTLLAGPGNGFVQVNPYRIALDTSRIYWTNEGNLDAGDGSIAAFDVMSAMPSELIVKQNTPRNFVVETDGTQAAKAIYWANYGVYKGDPAVNPDTTFSEKVMMVDLADPMKTPVALADGHRPSGIAVDTAAGVVYWSNESDNTIMKVALTGADKSAHLVAVNQNSPGDIAVDAGFVYWVNTGTATSPGAVMRISKGAPEPKP